MTVQVTVYPTMSNRIRRMSRRRRKIALGRIARAVGRAMLVNEDAIRLAIARVVDNAKGRP